MTHLDTVYNNTTEQKVIEACVNANIPCLLMGETGTGKTTIIRHLAHKNEKTLVRINLNGQTGREELVGKYVLIEGSTVWQDGPLLSGIKNGDWILLDEINAALPEVLFVIQALSESNDGQLGSILLSEKDGEVVIPHIESRIFATANPSDRYIGTKDFNPATLSRFVPVNINPLTEAEETKLLSERYPDIKKTIIKRLTTISTELRRLHASEKIEFFCSTRELVQVCDLVTSGLEFDIAVQAIIPNKIMDKLERADVIKELEKVVSIQEPTMARYITEIEELRSSSGKIRETEDKLKAVTTQLESAIIERDEAKGELLKLKEATAHTELLLKMIKENF